MVAILRSERLVLRPLIASDAANLSAIANDRRIADATISVPHPFSVDVASDWIDRCKIGWAQRHRFAFGIFARDLPPEPMLGYIGLHDVDVEHQQAELSFWIGAAHEGRGFVTEGALEVIRFAFSDAVGLNRLCAFHMVRNEGSRRVLMRLGFRPEGLLRQRVRKWGVFEDVLAWSRLRSDP